MQSAHFMREMTNKTVVERQRLRENSDAMSCAKEAIPVLLVFFVTHPQKKLQNKNKPRENSEDNF